MFLCVHRQRSKPLPKKYVPSAEQEGIARPAPCSVGIAEQESFPFTQQRHLPLHAKIACLGNTQRRLLVRAAPIVWQAKSRQPGRQFLLQPAQTAARALNRASALQTAPP